MFCISEVSLSDVGNDVVIIMITHTRSSHITVGIFEPKNCKKNIGSAISKTPLATNVHKLLKKSLKVVIFFAPFIFKIAHSANTP